MFSGKSTELQRQIRRHMLAKRKCLIINYAKDERYSKDSVIVTHDRHEMRALKILSLD